MSDATSFTQAGYVGEDVESVIERLLQVIIIIQTPPTNITIVVLIPHDALCIGMRL